MPAGADGARHTPGIQHEKFDTTRGLWFRIPTAKSEIIMLGTYAKTEVINRQQFSGGTSPGESVMCPNPSTLFGMPAQTVPSVRRMALH